MREAGYPTIVHDFNVDSHYLIKEANPSLARLTNILKHRWLIKENMQYSYIFFVGIVAGFQSAKMNWISIEESFTGLNCIRER